MTFRIGIISDTHGLLRPEAERCLMGVDHIIHAGDIVFDGTPQEIKAKGPSLDDVFHQLTGAALPKA